MMERLYDRRRRRLDPAFLTAFRFPYVYDRDVDPTESPRTILVTSYV